MSLLHSKSRVESQEAKVDKQAEKYSVSIAGEFYVAAELQRRGILAAVTYGNAKRADVVAFSSTREKTVVVEVKSTQKTKWVIGGKLPIPLERPWVFVRIPEADEQPPNFYVLTQEEVHNLCKPDHEEYLARYKTKHGEDYGDKVGVVSIKRAQIEDKKYKDAWWKIINQILPSQQEKKTLPYLMVMEK